MREGEGVFPGLRQNIPFGGLWERKRGARDDGGRKKLAVEKRLFTPIPEIRVTKDKLAKSCSPSQLPF